MKTSKPGLFEQLKEKRPLSTRPVSPPELFFQLRFDDEKALLAVVDRSGTVLELDYRRYRGSVRQVLKMLERISVRNARSIDWRPSTNGIDLSENDFLLWHLQGDPSLVDVDFQPIPISTEGARLSVRISEDGQLSCRFVLQHGETETADFRIISENFVYADGLLYPVAALGENFSLIPEFETRILPSELEKYLSLLFSYCDHIHIGYRDFRLMDAAPQETRPALVFEKVCADHSLYLRVVDALPGFDPDFFEQYDLSRVVTVNDAEKMILRSELVQTGHEVLIRKLKTHLNRLGRHLEVEGQGYYEEGNLFIIEAELAEQLVYEKLPGLAAVYAVYGAEDLKSYRVRTAKPELSLSLSHGIDFLEGDVSLRFETEVFSLFEVLHHYRRHAYVQLSDGKRQLLDPDYVQRLERIFQHRRDRERISFFDLPLIEELIGERLANDHFKHARAVFEGFNTIRDRPVILPRLNAQLRSYQEDGYRWLSYLNQQKLGGCLADDMGLGKTLQAIALLSDIYPAQSRPSLVVIPRSLIYNWQQEFRRFSPGLDVFTYYGPDRDPSRLGSCQIVLTTYGMVRSDVDELRHLSFAAVILDESQQIKNVSSQISRAVMTLQADQRLALSGTPIENNLGELYALFRFLNPAMFGSLERFHRHYLLPIQQYGDETAAEELKRKIRPFILRRLKKDVLTDLPDKVEQVLYVEMTDAQSEFYEQRRRFLDESIRRQIDSDGIENAQFHVLQAITDLRQIASIPEAKSEGLIVSPKRERLLEQLEDAVANDHKILIFANFLAILDFLADDLHQARIDFEIMTGATRDRANRVKRFQEDVGCRVFLMTLKTGGLGLNLTAADTVFIYDPWWNLAAEKQAVDRAHRIGQDKTVFSFKLITRGTIEEKIMRLQEQKKALFDAVISQDIPGSTFLNREDIDFLLGDDR